MKINLKDEKLNYCGRIDWSNPKNPVFVFPATYLQFRFFGRSAVITVENHHVCWSNYVGAIVDGIQKTFELREQGETRIELLNEEQEGEHVVLFLKRQDCCHEMTLKLLELDDGAKLLDPPEVPIRRIEVYGDSVSAGEVSEALDYVGKPDPEHHGQYSNSYYSYAWITARKLGAQLHDVAQGGIPLLNGNGWVAPPYYPGMEFMWDKLHYHPQLGKAVDWDFSLYTPHVVIVAIAQNDSNPDDYMRTDPMGLRAEYWKYKYGELVKNIRKKYPKTLIILTTTLLEHDKNWDDAIEEVCNQLGDERIMHFLYKRNGCGTPGHLRIPEAEEMANELVDFINGLTVPVWDEM
ncbi:MAG: electron transporter RnfD [Lachnospiraceae bacterium]|nr:electron transporter RnfD [Lachnospiraceae bacterium]